MDTGSIRYCALALGIMHAERYVPPSFSRYSRLRVTTSSILSFPKAFSIMIISPYSRQRRALVITFRTHLFMEWISQFNQYSCMRQPLWHARLAFPGICLRLDLFGLPLSRRTASATMSASLSRPFSFSVGPELFITIVFWFGDANILIISLRMTWPRISRWGSSRRDWNGYNWWRWSAPEIVIIIIIVSPRRSAIECIETRLSPK